jgi:hypothetical protein
MYDSNIYIRCKSMCGYVCNRAGALYFYMTLSFARHDQSFPMWRLQTFRSRTFRKTFQVSVNTRRSSDYINISVPPVVHDGRSEMIYHHLWIKKRANSTTTKNGALNHDQQHCYLHVPTVNQRRLVQLISSWWWAWGCPKHVELYLNDMQ